MENFIERHEFDQYSQRMEDEHKRQNHRISEAEKALEQNNKLLVSVEKLALSMENMQKELSNQGTRLEELESRDGKMWRKVASHLITTALGIVIAYLFMQIGM